VAIAVYLLSLLGGWVMGLPVSAAPSTEENVNAPARQATAVVTSPPRSPVSATVTPSSDPSDPSTTPEPTAQPPAPADGPAPLEYRVREGDTLGAIARAHAVSVEDLIAANGLADPNLLYVGQTLVIPGGDPASEPPPSTPAPARPTPVPSPAPPAAVGEERWIDVDLAQQRLTAYEGSAAVHTTLVSTGLPATPTPVGQFRIWIKLRYDDMAGADYYIEDVPYVMYFHEGYGLHGVTWHGNFGHPMSHGCVNLPTAEAEWLFNWAEVGTLVNIHG